VCARGAGMAAAVGSSCVLLLEEQGRRRRQKAQSIEGVSLSTAARMLHSARLLAVGERWRGALKGHGHLQRAVKGARYSSFWRAQGH
jgi:hypothetical protein